MFQNWLGTDSDLRTKFNLAQFDSGPVRIPKHPLPSQPFSRNFHSGTRRISANSCYRDIQESIHLVAMLVNIEGIDGSGKGTQAARLQARLRARALKVELVSFPRYRETHFGHKVADFLNGRFGELHQVNPFLASLLYAGDRFESRGWLEQLIAENDIVILDRYVPSNMAHQASKLEGAERTELIQWIATIEFEVYKLPRPDLCILLDIPPRVAQQLIARKAPRDYTDQAADLQESDPEHLTRAREVYLELAHANPVWRIIPCVVNEKLRTPDEIEAEIGELVQCS